MTSNDGLPGVILRFNGSTLIETKRGTKVAKVTLDAEVADDAIWLSVEAKLKEGLKVYSVDDFKTELLNALREENKKLDADNKVLRAALDTTQNENRQMKSALSVLHRQIEG